MRIAVSGTHGSGKSTLIDAFLEHHDDYIHEPEAYVLLEELYGETFAGQPSIADFERQLQFHLEVVRRYGPRDNVIFERSPFDYVAYMLALGERDARRREWIDEACAAADGLDLIVFLPLDPHVPIAIAEEEDLPLREAVDELLTAMLIDDEFDCFGDGKPIRVVARGEVSARLAVLSAASRFDGEKTPR